MEPQEIYKYSISYKIINTPYKKIHTVFKVLTWNKFNDFFNTSDIIKSISFGLLKTRLRNIIYYCIFSLLNTTNQ